MWFQLDPRQFNNQNNTPCSPLRCDFTMSTVYCCVVKNWIKCIQLYIYTYTYICPNAVLTNYTQSHTHGHSWHQMDSRSTFVRLCERLTERWANDRMSEVWSVYGEANKDFLCWPTTKGKNHFHGIEKLYTFNWIIRHENAMHISHLAFGTVSCLINPYFTVDW